VTGQANPRPLATPTALARAIVLAGVLLACGCGALGATGEIPFDLPADSAERSLRLFSRQSGAEVVFASRIAKGVRTQPVKGEMPARQALELMLSGTSLAVFEDQVGAFSIRREAADPKSNDANRPHSGGTPHRESEKKTKPTHPSPP
jgi:hypothetical protein